MLCNIGPRGRIASEPRTLDSGSYADADADADSGEQRAESGEQRAATNRAVAIFLPPTRRHRTGAVSSFRSSDKMLPASAMALRILFAITTSCYEWPTTRLELSASARGCRNRLACGSERNQSAAIDARR